MKQRGEIRIGLGQHRCDVTVNQCFHEHGSLHIRQNVDKNRNDNSDAMYGIIL